MGHYTEESLIEDIRASRREKVHGMKTGGKAGVSPHLLYREVRGRVSINELISLFEALRRKGIVMIHGREGYISDRLRPFCVIEDSLDENFFTEGGWKGASAMYHSVRIYVVSDGLPETIARQNVVRRSLSRHSSLDPRG